MHLQLYWSTFATGDPGRLIDGPDRGFKEEPSTDTLDEIARDELLLEIAFIKRGRNPGSDRINASLKGLQLISPGQALKGGRTVSKERSDFCLSAAESGIIIEDTLLLAQCLQLWNQVRKRRAAASHNRRGCRAQVQRHKP